MSAPRIVIQCRTSSTRLPAKALLPLAGLPMAVLCAKRAGNRGHSVIVATSTDPSDDLLVKTLERHSLPCFRGSLQDVLQRFTDACSAMQDDEMVVRLTADNAFPDGAFIEKLFEDAKRRQASYLGTWSPIDGLPYGLSAEIFTVRALREANRDATSASDREHVTPWIRRRYGSPVFAPPDLERSYAHLRCTVDTCDDYLALASLFANESNPVAVPWKELTSHLQAQTPEISDIVPFSVRGNAVHSRLALGTVQLGLKYGAANTSGQPDIAESARIVRHAIASGMTAIDTARAYGESETRLGEILAGGLGARCSVTTKLAPLDDLPPDASTFTVNAAVDASVFQSCRELRVHALPTLLLHRFHHRTSHQGAIWSRLIELKRAGIIGKLGVSVNYPDEALAAFADPDITHIQLPFNILDQRWHRAGIPQKAHARPDVIVHARSLFLQGILVSQSAAWPLEAPAAQGWINRLESAAQHFGYTNRAELCFAYGLAQDWISALVIGVETLTQLTDNLRLVQTKPMPINDAVACAARFADADDRLVTPSKWKD